MLYRPSNSLGFKGLWLYPDIIYMIQHTRMAIVLFINSFLSDILRQHSGVAKEHKASE
jgi:hypothetical protein